MSQRWCYWEKSWFPSYRVSHMFNITWATVKEKNASLYSPTQSTPCPNLVCHLRRWADEWPFGLSFTSSTLRNVFGSRWIRPGRIDLTSGSTPNDHSRIHIKLFSGMPGMELKSSREGSPGLIGLPRATKTHADPSDTAPGSASVPPYSQHQPRPGVAFRSQWAEDGELEGGSSPTGGHLAPKMGMT